MARTRSSTVLRFALLWSAIAALFSLSNVSGYVTQGRSVDWLRAVGLEFWYWVPWLLVTPVLLWSARRFPLDPEARTRNVAVHMAVMVGVMVPQAAFTLAGDVWLLRNQLVRLTEAYWNAYPILLFTAFWKYWVFMAVYHAFAYYRKYRERELRASRLEAELANAKLRTLKMQLQPHFLFNTLHSVSMLNLRDVDQANRLLIRLADLLRLTLDKSGAQEVTLGEELEFIGRYLEIERVRFEDRLEVVIDVPPSLMVALVPSLILQPIVENAIRHGMEPSTETATVRIRAHQHDDSLTLQVTDSGPGLPEDWNRDGRRMGTGLANTRARLEALYGEAHGFRLRQDWGAGLTAEITVPLRRTEE